MRTSLLLDSWKAALLHSVRSTGACSRQTCYLTQVFVFFLFFFLLFCATDLKAADTIICGYIHASASIHAGL